MASIPSFKRILREKFPSDLKWMGLLLTPLNSFMEDISLALNKRLTISQNMDAELKQITVNGSYPVKVSWGRPSRPTVGLIGKIERSDNSSVSLSNAASLVWSYNQAGQIQIDGMPGLDDTSIKQYKITLVFYTG